MPSPFPGLDPFIEEQYRWHSFHTTFIVACCASLNRDLPANYYADMDRRQILEPPDPPGIVSLDHPTQKFIEIRNLPDRALVTTIELLLATNKSAGDDREDYLARRAGRLRHGVNTVDLDLLLAGQPDVSLDLQAAFTHVYDRNRYAMIIRCDQPLSYIFDEADGEWLAGLLAD
jgi:hypothetical protein